MSQPIDVGSFCSRNSLGMQQSLWAGVWSEARSEVRSEQGDYTNTTLSHRRQMHPAANNLHHLCLARALLSLWQQHPKPCWCRDTGCPRVTCSPVKGSDCCTGSCISGTADLGSGKGRVREGLSMVLVQPLYISKGRKKADAGEWS